MKDKFKHATVEDRGSMQFATTDGIILNIPPNAFTHARSLLLSPIKEEFTNKIIMPRYIFLTEAVAYVLERHGMIQEHIGHDEFIVCDLSILAGFMRYLGMKIIKYFTTEDGCIQLLNDTKNLKLSEIRPVVMFTQPNDDSVMHIEFGIDLSERPNLCEIFPEGMRARFGVMGCNLVRIILNRNNGKYNMETCAELSKDKMQGITIQFLSALATSINSVPEAIMDSSDTLSQCHGCLHIGSINGKHKSINGTLMLPLSWCSNCHGAAFCSRHCLRKHYKVHKRTCKNERIAVVFTYDDWGR
jgi:hypothetical protein